MDVAPVVLGSGKRYFGPVDAQHLLEDPHVVIQGDRVLHLRYRVRRQGADDAFRDDLPRLGHEAAQRDLIITGQATDGTASVEHRVCGVEYGLALEVFCINQSGRCKPGCNLRPSPQCSSTGPEGWFRKTTRSASSLHKLRHRLAGTTNPCRDLCLRDMPVGQHTLNAHAGESLNVSDR
jgi:hypothetical protein